MMQRLTSWAEANWVTPFAERSTEEEWLDDLTMGGEELRTSLLQLEQVNIWTGGHRAAVRSLKSAISLLRDKLGDETRIVDAGCGSGDNLRAIARWARRNGMKLELLGVDANAHTLELAAELSRDFPEISYRCMDVFGAEFRALQKDIIVTALFCHHFPSAQLREWIGSLRGSTQCLVINDLQRHPLPSCLFRALCWAIGASPMTLHDGLVSIRRGFRREEWRDLLEPIASGRYDIAWRWAFRYEVVVRP
jgi:SAM-dependent methyltransferase